MFCLTILVWWFIKLHSKGSLNEEEIQINKISWIEDCCLLFLRSWIPTLLIRKHPIPSQQRTLSFAFSLLNLYNVEVSCLSAGRPVLTLILSFANVLVEPQRGKFPKVQSSNRNENNWFLVLAVQSSFLIFVQLPLIIKMQRISIIPDERVNTNKFNQ